MIFLTSDRGKRGDYDWTTMNEPLCLIVGESKQIRSGNNINSIFALAYFVRLEMIHEIRI
jgi:hypothetical protein